MAVVASASSIPDISCVSSKLWTLAVLVSALTWVRWGLADDAAGPGGVESVELAGTAVVRDKLVAGVPAEAAGNFCKVVLGGPAETA